MTTKITHLKELESEAIYVIREVAAQFEKPALLFSGGKDSIVLAYLSYKAFYPAPIPFPFVHIDTGHNFTETIDYRDELVKRLGVKLIVGSVQQSIDEGRVVEEKGYNASRNKLQTVTLLDTLEKYKFDAAIGGARRDEEKARAKERFFSHRDEFGQWDPKNQRPELWNLFNGKKNIGEHFRVFPISNWTEMDVWQYILQENIPLPSLYYTHEREVFNRDGVWLAKYPFMQLKPDEKVEVKRVRCRTIGDITCTGLTLSSADTIEDIVEQTKRHSYIASLLNIDYVIVAINKMDLVDFSEQVYNDIKTEYAEVAKKLGLKNVYFIPISALKGDNVVNASDNTPWYKGETLLHLLEQVPLKEGVERLPFRFPVQYVVRPQTTEWPDYRAYAGRIASGSIKVGDKVTVLPSHTVSTVSRIDEGTKQIDEAQAPQSVSISLADDVDVSRGAQIVKSDNIPYEGQQVEILLCWLNHRPLQLRQKYVIRHTTDELQGFVTAVRYKVNINTLENIHDDATINMNDIAKVTLKVSKPLAYDLYKDNRTTGSLIFIAEGTNETVGAAMIVE